MIEVVINRNGNKIELPAINEGYVGDVCIRAGYKHLNVLDVVNYKDIKWEGIEFNRLYIKEGALYRFNNWIGTFPWTSIEIEQIGTYKEEN